MVYQKQALLQLDMKEKMYIIVNNKYICLALVTATYFLYQQHYCCYLCTFRNSLSQIVPKSPCYPQFFSRFVQDEPRPVEFVVLNAFFVNVVSLELCLNFSSHTPLMGSLSKDSLSYL